MHPPNASHKKYRPGVKVARKRNEQEAFREAIKAEGVADRRAAKAARKSASVEASKARKHERSMLLMLMQAMQNLRYLIDFGVSERELK